MLRGAVLAVGILMLLAGVATAGLGVPGAPLWLLIAGGTITAGTLLERVIYKPLLREKPGAGWVKTAERFIDPDTGQPVDVFYNPRTGERQYVADEPEKKA
ncbi:hypothetical protein [Reyranella soli]|jgi:hypothetical protein|uniref:Uncharacterized protein n=1 Tax=Reyranella soli TaxID=1230389 RepID=A0A512N323_9HYPH|nr:hypothetical protein [Reyranella soli]GEP53372.1 hypothetical protein RSO01_05380 [Reyranella soli]